MKILLQTVTTVLLVAVSGFCVFGFLATFEPLPPVQQWTWRAVYSIAAALCVGGVVRCWRTHAPAR